MTPREWADKRWQCAQRAADEARANSDDSTVSLAEWMYIALLRWETEVGRKLREARITELENALRSFEHFGFLDDVHCYFCDAKVDENEEDVTHYADCIWSAARKVLGEGK